MSGVAKECHSAYVDVKTTLYILILRSYCAEESSLMRTKKLQDNEWINHLKYMYVHCPTNEIGIVCTSLRVTITRFLRAHFPKADSSIKVTKEHYSLMAIKLSRLSYCIKRTKQLLLSTEI